MDVRRSVLIWLLLAWVAALHAQSVPFADLARHPQYQTVKISPDGQYLAATAVVKGQSVLALIHLADMKGHLVRPREKDDVVDFWWASGSRVLYSVGVREGGYDSPLATGELFGVDADGGMPELLYGQRAGSFETAEFIARIPGDSHRALVAFSSWAAAGREGYLTEADVVGTTSGFTSHKVIVAPGRNMSFVADHQGRIRFSYGEDNLGHARIYLHPVDGDGWKEMPRAESARCFPIRFDRSDALAYFDCGAGDNPSVQSWNPLTDAWHTIWSHPGLEADGLLQGMAHDDVLGVVFSDGRPAATLLDASAASARILVQLMKQFPGEQVRFVSGTDDGRLSVVLVDADVDPGMFYLYDRNANKLTPLLARMPWIQPERMARKQPVQLAARDGLQLHGYLSLPAGVQRASNLPMVVFVHGGPYGVRDAWDFDPYVQAMASRGYAVLQVNYRGSGGYGYAFERAGWREWGGRMQDDITDATRWAIAQGIADPQRICIFGGSYGGYAALEGAVKEPDLYRCAIGYVGVYDLALMYHRGDIPQSSSGEDYLKRVLGEDMSQLARRSPINQLDRLKARVMLVVGGKDERVPPIQGSNMHMALSKRHVAHEWIDKPDEMHGFYNEANVAELYRRIVQFLGANIGPGVSGGVTAGAGKPVSH